MSAITDYVIIPFYTGLTGSKKQDQDLVKNNPQHSRPDLREFYLKKTLENMRKITRKLVIIGVCTDYDAKVASLIGNKVFSMDPGSGTSKIISNNFQVINLAQFIPPLDIGNLASGPKMLPLALCAMTQMQTFMEPDEVIMFNEADQLLYGHTLADQLKNLKQGEVLIPHRYEQIYQHKSDNKETGADRGPLVTILENIAKKYVLPNANAQKLKIRVNVSEHAVEYSGETQVEYMEPETPNQAYAAAYIMHVKTFKDIPFQLYHNLPLESASFSVFYAKRVHNRTVHLKQPVFAQDLYVIHLSGYEYHAKLAGSSVTEDDFQ